ncbi:hypothetical protein A2957_03050 [Candidatus Roizmanbacteria bacterium RIFCSPLOWO2_01_FULL_38_11]|uniref:Uncharacterized protein n=1 Tax=Candidatus Roizmanbacteria bacterium RIFCSPLOWO2_01_FULL_38_11 TaxID=1802060 RepID=A0A1F7IN83_9BACT|nr:MAG: hypothetical protein A2957_03050 [Candidatus Roizmanbacteria bacterium RIFCSPLOWO2_01_FULL_38_11]
MELEIEQLHKKAVDAALDFNWDTAIRINLQIIKLDNNYIDAYLSLGYAYLETGRLTHAKKYYREALKIDPANMIAHNNIDKISILSKKGSKISPSKNGVELDPDIFMNIRGKTKVISLLNLGQPEILVKLKIGEKVDLKVKKRRIEVRTKEGDYIGALPDDISKRLIFFLDGKSEYTTYIKAATKNSVDVFIKEERKGKKVSDYLSFPDNIQDDLKKLIGKDEDTHEETVSDDSQSDDSDEGTGEEDVFNELDHLESEPEDSDESFLSQIEPENDDDDEYDE